MPDARDSKQPTRSPAGAVARELLIGVAHDPELKLLGDEFRRG
jgi:hypothetical protein